MPIAHAETLFPLPSAPFVRPVSHDTTLCSCVLYLRSLGLDVRGDADAIPANTTFAETEPGDAVLLTYTDKTTGKPIGHVAEVISIDGTSIIIQEANFKPCATDTRTIDASDEHIRGFYSLHAKPLDFTSPQHTTPLP